MGLGGILQELKTEGVLALYHDYRSGRLVDYSGNGNNGVASSGTVFNKQGTCFISTTDEVTVADSVSLRVSNCSIAVLGDFVSQSSNEALFGRSNGATSLLWFYLDALSLRLFDGTNARNLLVTLQGTKYLAFSLTSGGIPVGYVNGLSIGNFSGIITPQIIAGTVIEIGNILNLNRLKSTLKAIVICGRSLTATEHSRLYSDLENMTWNTKGLTPGPMMP